MKSTLDAALRLSTKTFLRKKPVPNPTTHIAGCALLLLFAGLASGIASQQLDRRDRDTTAQLMPLYAIPSPLYRPGEDMSVTAQTSDDSPEAREVSAR